VSDELTLRRHLASALSSDDDRSKLRAGELHALLGEFTDAYKMFTQATQSKIEEVRWVALVKLATAMKFIGCFSLEKMLEPLMDAYELRPRFADPLIVASQFCREAGKVHTALLFSTTAIGIPMPDDTRDPDVYAWKTVYEYALCAAQVPIYYENALGAFNEILSRNDIRLPDAVRASCVAERQKLLEDLP